MGEFRQDRTSGAWVIVAPGRSRRPHDEQAVSGASKGVPAHDPSCPFCPGNEHLLPAIVDETRTEGSPGWSVRVVPNKYPALRSDGDPLPADLLPGVPVQGFGDHEVIIESPRHDLDLCDLAAQNVSAILETYRARYTMLAAQPGIKSVLVFRNRGQSAGASLRHPHSQIIATGIMPPRLAAAAAWAREWHGRTGRCPTCEDLCVETSDGNRIIETTERFVVVVPFAAVGPYEVRIIPRRHQPSFALADNSDLAELGTLLQRTIRRLDAWLGRQPYNYVIESGCESMVDAVSFHWRLRIVPILTMPGGFELASGVPINSSLPEDDAAALREAEFIPVPTA